MPNLRKFIKSLLTPSGSNKGSSSSSLCDTWEQEHVSLKSAEGGSGSQTPKQPPSEQMEILYDPNPYNFFLLCPKHAQPGLVQEIYEDEMAHLLCLFNGKLHPGLSPGVAREELSRRTKLTPDMKTKIQRRMEELDVSRNALMDPKKRAIVDERYGDRTNCQVCAESPQVNDREPIALLDQLSSGLQSHPRPGSKEWREYRANSERERMERERKNS
ncbi:hypothetical protein TWF788_009555 [Orbilia oligospora]|uniref:Uncharacterized protein n=1 Tax=Orbilia oligospora TaxID=2813651 RepID=A0A7C8PM39_ORBOL|nr:hypothetical protein TWF788_009555 [Orbilia oligospora]